MTDDISSVNPKHFSTQISNSTVNEDFENEDFRAIIRNASYDVCCFCIVFGFQNHLLQFLTEATFIE